MYKISNHELEPSRDGSNVSSTLNIKKEHVKNSILIILGLIIAILGIFAKPVVTHYYYIFILDLRILFLLIGVILCLYGIVNYLLVKRGDSYEKMKHPIEDFTIILMSPIFVLLFASLLNSNSAFLFVSRSFVFIAIPQVWYSIVLLFGILIAILISAIITGPSLYYLYLYLFRREKYQMIIKKKERWLRFSEPFIFFRRIPMTKIYARFSHYYKQVFGVFVLVGILIIIINHFLIYSLEIFFSLDFNIMNNPEFPFILAGIVFLRTRKVGFLIFQFAVIKCVFYEVLIPLLFYSLII